MKLRILVLNLVLLSACQENQTGVVPNVTPSSAPTSSVTATPSSIPTHLPTSTPSVEPSDIDPSTTPHEQAACDFDSPEVTFHVYSNDQNVDFNYPSVKLDKSKPLNSPMLKLNEKVTGTLQQNRITFNRPQNEVQIQISAAGYDTLSQTLPTSNLCHNNYIALSPLSNEERESTPIPVNKTLLAHNVKLNQHTETGFEYAVIPNLVEFEKIAPKFSLLWSNSPLESEKLDSFRNAFKNGQQLVLISNGSQGFGDLFELVTRISYKEKTSILGTHLNSFQPDPKPIYPYGDRFIEQIEAVFIPKETTVMVMDLLKAGAGGGSKQRLEVVLSNALLPIQ